MTPRPTVNVTVDEVALQLFAKLYMDTAGRDPVFLIGKSFDLAEKFVEVAAERKREG